MNARTTYSDAQNVALVTQVGSVCPKCDKPLFRKKNKKTYKDYEIAHIYPLNPTKEEIELLKNETKLSDDLNDEDNVIPLCLACHHNLDNPRTVEEYRELIRIKKDLIARSGQESSWGQYNIEEEISEIVELLYSSIHENQTSQLNFDPKDIAGKTDSSISRPTVRKIKNNVSDYYILIRTKMAAIDTYKLDFSTIVSHQIRSYYLKQKQNGLDQQAIFDNIVKWILVKTKPGSIDGAEIITSFFIQNCEVFE